MSNKLDFSKCDVFLVDGNGNSELIFKDFKTDLIQEEIDRLNNQRDEK